MSLELPEGITFNKIVGPSLEVEQVLQDSSKWQCPQCDLQFELLLIGENGRYSGQIKTSGNNSVNWQGPLPKDEQKALKFLQETLKKKVDTHKKRH
jgi:hypothetical protein